MKKINILILAIIVSGTGMLASCSKKSDNTNNPPANKPVASFKVGKGYISHDTILLSGFVFKVGVTATSNATSGANLSRFKVTRTFNNIPDTVYDTTFNLTSFSIDINANANYSAGVETWTFTVTDKNNQVTDLTLKITTQADDSPIVNRSMQPLYLRKECRIGMHDNAFTYKIN